MSKGKRDIEAKNDDVEVLTPEKVANMVNKWNQIKIKRSKIPPEVRMAIRTFHAVGYTRKQLSTLFQVGEGSVSEIVNSIAKEDEGRFSDLSDSLKRQFPAKLRSTANSILSRITDEDIEKASLLQKATSAGIMIDKAAQAEDGHQVTVHHHYGRAAKSKQDIITLNAKLADSDDKNKGLISGV